MTAGMTGMKPLWAFVSETWKQHGIDPSNADAVRGIINRSYALDNVSVVVCADEFSKPYGMLKERCQELYPGSAWIGWGEPAGFGYKKSPAAAERSPAEHGTG